MLKSIPDGVGTEENINTLKKIQAFARKHPTIYLPSHDQEAERRLREQIIAPIYEET